MRARVLVIVVLLLSYGAVGARQPAVRMAVALPVPAERIADALEILSVDRSRFVLDVVRALFTMGLIEGDMRQRGNLRTALLAAPFTPGEIVPLPLDASIWRETLLERQVPDNQIIGAILADRSTALLYHGLAGLDDETLAWLGPERETLRHLLRHAGAFAVFGPSVRVRAGRIVVPGGADAEPMWQAIVGADPARPSAFVRRLFGDESGMLAWFYDAIANLDEPRLKFATSAALPTPARIERVRALLDVFEHAGSDWQPEKQPFSRRPFDPALTLAVIRVNADGNLTGPAQRGVWERVFVNDASGRPQSPPREASVLDPAPVDAAWLVSRLHRVPVDLGRRRLETFLFAQRVFPTVAAPDPLIVGTLRAYETLPSLMLTLERAGVTSAGTMSAMAAHAQALTEIGDDQTRTLALSEFQASLGILDRIIRSGGVSRADGEGLIARLAMVDHSSRGYGARIAAWIQRDLLSKLTQVNGESSDALEDTLLAGMAGVRVTDARDRIVEWEGRRYRVNAARAEELRLHRVRERQGGTTLQAALQSAQQTPKPGGDRVLVNTLTSILYAAYLGDPQGPALAAGNVALRHDLGATGVVGPRAAWRLPTEGHSAKGWKVTGSLLGLDVALARMSLRRLDSNVMPPEPRMVSSERQTAALTVSLLNPLTLGDAARDEIAAALARGRARLDALDGSGSNDADVEAIARDAGLSSWRREALRWTLAHDGARRSEQLSVVELMWLGRPRASAAVSLDGWGAAMLPLSGCVCLAMPTAQPWEVFSGRPSQGLLATRGADVSIVVADTLAALDLPAQIAPGVIAYAMQEVIDQARPAHFDDWSGFSRAASTLSRDNLIDYIAAQTAGGPLLPASSSEDRQP
jgi:hypothetical protein